MPAPLRSLLTAAAVCVSLVIAQGDPQLEGTWTTKSRKVVTGPVSAQTLLRPSQVPRMGFYDPVNEKMFEPDLTGISYSFTKDGFYEEAYYRAISNPTTPSCPQGIIQWQHGKYIKHSNNSLTLSPFAVDGRQLQSNPCQFQSSVYTRYSQFEMIKKYSVAPDPYNKAPRLDLYRFDGSPMNPMYLAYKPPQMLPTQTLNPTAASSTGGAQPTGKAKRDLQGDHYAEEPLNKYVLVKRREPINTDKWWWIGVGMTGIGGMAYYYC
ncbi:MAG: hypothetical protein Q9164_000139 [Protoblastenia rupestris]